MTNNEINICDDSGKEKKRTYFFSAVYIEDGNQIFGNFQYDFSPFPLVDELHDIIKKRNPGAIMIVVLSITQLPKEFCFLQFDFDSKSMCYE